AVAHSLVAYTSLFLSPARFLSGPCVEVTQLGSGPSSAKHYEYASRRDPQLLIVASSSPCEVLADDAIVVSIMFWRIRSADEVGHQTGRPRMQRRRGHGPESVDARTT